MTALCVCEYVSGIYRKLGLDETQIRKLQTVVLKVISVPTRSCSARRRTLPLLTVLASSWTARHMDDLTGSWNLISQRIRLWTFDMRDDIDTKRK